jgi:putative transcriptional regulator
MSPKKGRILISEPFLSGSYFNRSIVFLVSFSEKGAVGFILNKRVDLKIHDVIKDFPDIDIPVYLGGPVATDSIYYIHKLGDKLPGSIHVLDDIYWGGDFDALLNRIKSGLIDLSEVRFFLGYSGWDAGQLERELKENSWLVNNIESGIVMQEPNRDSWFDSVKKVDRRYSVWENFPENPAMN